MSKETTTERKIVVTMENEKGEKVSLTQFEFDALCKLLELFRIPKDKKE